MLNTISNISRKTDRYGNVHMISFIGATLSRLAYFDDNKFLTKYNSIMGPVIQPRVLKGIDSVTPNDLFDLLDDQKVFGLDKSKNDIFKDYDVDIIEIENDKLKTVNLIIRRKNQNCNLN